MSRAVTITLGSGVLIRGGAIPTGIDENVHPGAVVWSWTLPAPFVSAQALPPTSAFVGWFSDDFK